MILRALLLAVALLPQTGWAAGVDEVVIRPAQTDPVTRLLARAGFGEIQRSYALVIGVSEFEEFNDLPTERDPIAMRDYLVEEAGFDHVHLLTGDKVTRARLQDLMIDEFGGLVGPNDRFLFYWSGHGETLERGGVERGFLPLADSRKDRFGTMISMENINAWDDFIEARQVLYLMDSCFSGLVGAAPQSDLADITRAQLSGPSRHVITAGRGDEQTIAVDALGGSVFTHALLKGLRGEADKFEDGLVSVGEIKAYLGIEVTRLRDRYGWQKSITPQLRDLRGSDGAFFFPIPAAFAPEQDRQDAPVAPLAEAQQALADLGYDPGPVTGETSLKTRTALILFQRAQGLAETGELDAATLGALPFALAALAQPQGHPQEEPVPEAPIVEGERQALAVPVPTARPDRTPSDPAAPPTAPSSAVTFRPCELCPELIRVEGGRMAYGPRGVDEDPPSITETVAPFYISTTEVTREHFREYLAHVSGVPALAGLQAAISDGKCYAWTAEDKMHRTGTGSLRTSELGDTYPVPCVSREDANAYLLWLNEDNPGPPYRLPTEAEFELLLERGFARPEDPRLAQIRALIDPSSTQVRPCVLGNFADASSQFSWRNTDCEDGHAGVAPVASFPPVAPGVYDLAGNLWEWVADCWRENLSLPLQTDGCETGTVKGGSFDDPVKNTLPEVRQPVAADRRQENIGFRIARDID